jgi:hypothetical protein
LQHLLMGGCTKLTDKGVASIARDPLTRSSRGQALKTLDLTFCLQITDDGLIQLAEQVFYIAL